jgi:hypothetical protein
MFEMMRLFDRRWYVFFLSVLMAGCNPQRALVPEDPGESRVAEEIVSPLPSRSSTLQERPGNGTGAQKAHQPLVVKRKNVD